MTAAPAMSTLINHQGIETHFAGQGMAAAAIPVGMTPVTVKKDLNRSAVTYMIVTAVKLGAVKAFDGNFFKRDPLHDAADPGYIVCNCFVLFSLHGFRSCCPALLGRKEGNIVGIPAA